MKKLETVEAVHTHTHTQYILPKRMETIYTRRELYFNKNEKEENKGTEFAFICDRFKGRNKAILNKVFILEILFIKNNKQQKVGLF